MNLEFFMGVAAGMACCGCWMIWDLIAKKKFLASSPRKMSITEHCNKAMGIIHEGNKAAGNAITRSLLRKAYPDHQIVHEEDGSWTCSKPVPKAGRTVEYDPSTPGSYEKALANASDLNLKSSDIGVVRAMLQSNAAAYARGLLSREEFGECEQMLTIALNRLERIK